jgi:hypothetical protein
MSVTRKQSDRRLLKLADFLYELPRKRFEYSAWVGDDWKGKSDLSCGTTACALGWATTMPYFRKLGLRLSKGGLVVMATGTAGLRYFGGSLRSAESVFLVTLEEARLLFAPLEEHHTDGLCPDPYNATPKQVAKHIRRFVASRAKQSEATQ